MDKWPRDQRYSCRGRRGKEEMMIKYGKSPSLCVPLELKSKGCLFPGNTCVCPIGFKTIEILGIPFNDILEYCN